MFVQVAAQVFGFFIVVFPFVMGLAAIRWFVEWLSIAIFPKRPKNHIRTTIKETTTIEIGETNVKATWKVKTSEPTKSMLEMDNDEGLAFWRSQTEGDDD